MPPQMLPGLAILYLCALLSAFLTAQKVSATHSIEKIRKMVILRIGKSERTNLRNMVLILTFLMIAFAMTRGSTPMYRVLVTNYTFSLLINIFISLLASIGLFGWLSALFISKQSKEKS